MYVPEYITIYQDLLVERQQPDRLWYPSVTEVFFLLLFKFLFTGIALAVSHNIPSHLYIFIAGSEVALLCLVLLVINQSLIA